NIYCFDLCFIIISNGYGFQFLSNSLDHNLQR
ncbi:hypothetical protein CP8484711_1321B, partial [Chlamydia psittaci 84-8471/1]